ncbi:DUF3829 domain-containing protein [Maribacter sp. 2210JD10-5]|uniref:DUF3829 domain-containing protein n=1 Tax=Maribacter sp. 2210JD10-5 TaxID=3386272 RepID=UPI0039BD3BD7
MKTIKKTFAIILALTLFQSCKDTNNSKGTETNANTSSNIEIDEKQAYINKYNAYIAIWNDVSPRVERSYNSLYNIINDKTGNPLKESEKYYIPAVPESSAIDYLERILNEKPEIPELDKLGPDIIKSYKAFREPLQQLSDYYKLQSYLDDDFEKSRELYFKIRGPIKNFIKASDALGPILQEIDNKLSTEALVEYKENNQLLLYNKGMIINSLKKHTAPLYEINYQEYDQLDLETYDQNLKELIAHYNAFKKLANDKDRLKREMNISRPSPFIIYYMDIDNYIKASRELRELSRNPKKYKAMKNTTESMGIGFASASHEKVTKAAEKVINSSNSLN